MIFKLRFTPNVIKDLESHRKSGDLAVLQKIEILLEE